MRVHKWLTTSGDANSWIGLIARSERVFVAGYPRPQGQGNSQSVKSKPEAYISSSQLTSLLIRTQSLIQRSYRDDIPPSALERFLPLVLDQEEDGGYVVPCFSSQGINYLHIRHNNLYR